MRKFVLTNAIGESWNLQDKNKAFFASPEGLGWADATEYVRAGSFYQPLELLWEQRAIAGSLFFLKKPYKTYFEFVRFASKSPLTLTYTTVTGATYNVKCRLSTIEKTELNEYRILECPVTFTALGLFYKIVTEYNDGSVTSGGKAYDYEYDFVYTNDIAESVSIQSDSMEDSPCKVIIYGPCTNPIWRHYVNGQLIALGSMTGEVGSGRMLVVDSTEIPYSITEQDLAGNLTADRYQLCNFDTDRFIFLQNGSNVITISHDGVETCPLRVEAHISYESV